MTLVLSVVAAPVLAEDEYASLPFDKNKRADFTWLKIINGKTPLAGNEAALDAYFTEYVFAEMTDPAKASQYPALRKSFHTRYVRPAAQTRVVLEHLNKLALRILTQIVEEQRDGKYFHPAARYNAVLLIGELDEVVAASRK